MARKLEGNPVKLPAPNSRATPGNRDPNTNGPELPRRKGYLWTVDKIWIAVQEPAYRDSPGALNCRLIFDSRIQENRIREDGDSYLFIIRRGPNLSCNEESIPGLAQVWAFFGRPIRFRRDSGGRFVSRNSP